MKMQSIGLIIVVCFRNQLNNPLLWLIWSETAVTSVSGGTFSDNLGVGTIIDNDAPASKPQSQSLLGRVKTLTGSAVSDVFTLENNTVSVIKGFEPNKDLIKLSGKESDFTTKTGNFGSGLPTGVGIFGKGELIALVTDVTPQSLTSNSFDYLV